MIPLMVAISARVRSRVLNVLAGCILVVLVGSVSAANMVLGSSADKASATARAEELFRESLVHLNGEGVEQDLLRAKSLLEQAAELGHMDAQQKLGRMYFFLPGHVDLEKTRYWWEQAARQGSAKARYQLSILHIKHLGPNPVDALAWMHLAHENGDPRAARLLPKLEQRLAVDPTVLAQRLTQLRREFNPPVTEQRDGWLAGVLQGVAANSLTTSTESEPVAEPELKPQPVSELEQPKPKPEAQPVPESLPELALAPQPRQQPKAEPEPKAELKPVPAPAQTEMPSAAIAAVQAVPTAAKGTRENAVPKAPASTKAARFDKGYYVQLAAVNTQDSANDFAVSVNGKHAEVLGRMQARVLQKQSGANGFKVWVGAFAQREDAGSLCGKLQSRDQACFVVRL